MMDDHEYELPNTFNNMRPEPKITPRRHAEASEVLARLRENPRAPRPSPLLEEYMKNQAAKLDQARKAKTQASVIAEHEHE